MINRNDAVDGGLKIQKTKPLRTASTGDTDLGTMMGGAYNPLFVQRRGTGDHEGCVRRGAQGVGV